MHGRGIEIHPSRCVIKTAVTIPIVCNTIATRILSSYFAEKSSASLNGPSPAITGREKEVLTRIALGNSNKAIARALAVSESAVKFHLRNLFRKLQVERRGELLERARERGLLS